MKLQQRKRQIRNAGLAGCLMTASGFLTCFLAVADNRRIDFSLWGPTIVSLILTIWIFKGSRLAASLMVLGLFVDRLFCFMTFPPSFYQVLILVVLAYFLVRGACAAFALHKSQESNGSERRSPDSLSYTLFSTISIALVTAITFSLPIKLIHSFRDSQPSKYPIHFAVGKGDLDTVKKLLQQGEDINLSGPLGTPLTIAARGGRPEIVRLLINNGANPNLSDWKGWSPIHNAVFPEQANLEVILELAKSGGEVDARDKHLRTPLHRAAQFGHAEAVRLLLYLGALATATDENGWTPLDRAGKHPDIQKILEEYTDISFNKNKMNLDQKIKLAHNLEQIFNLHSTAEQYRMLGEYDKAIATHEQLLEILEKTHGTDHPEVTKRVNIIAEMYRNQGEYAKAEPLFKRALENTEKTLGSDHPDVATILMNLVVLYRDTGRVSQAEALSKRALQIRSIKR